MTDVQGDSVAVANDVAAAAPDVVSRLAEQLYASACKLDPIEDEPRWRALPEQDRRLYRALIDDLLCYPDLLRSAMTATGGPAVARTPRAIRRRPALSLVLWALLATALICGGAALSPDRMAAFVSTFQEWTSAVAS